MYFYSNLTRTRLVHDRFSRLQASIQQDNELYCKAASSVRRVRSLMITASPNSLLCGRQSPRRSDPGRHKPESSRRSVILSRQDQILGEGCHERKGKEHAETQALATARAEGGTAVGLVSPGRMQWLAAVTAGRNPTAKPCEMSS